jgi:glycosyltransferase involved in cell wall biosynthesis
LARELISLGVSVDVFVGRTDGGTLALPLFRELNGYDLVHVQSSPYGAFIHGVPFVVTVHSPVLVEWAHYSSKSRLKSFPAFVAEKITFRKASAVMAVSKRTASDLVHRYGIESGRIAVIGNGVDYQRFVPTDRDVRRPNHILMVSRLERRKNIEESLRALSTIDGAEYEAQIAGEGTERTRLEELARSLGVKIDFLGRVSEDALLSLYHRAGIFLTSSYSEGFGLSLLEAMASGCAVIASNIPTHRSLIRSGSNGLIYKDPTGVKSHIRLLLSDPDLARRLGSAAIETAQQYSWRSVARRVLDVYNRCLNNA